MTLTPDPLPPPSDAPDVGCPNAENKILSLDEKDPVVAVVREDFSTCDCRKLWLDYHKRIVKCRTCGKVLDAFEWIAKYGRLESSLMSRLQYLENEYKNRSAKVEELRGEEQNTKNRIRAAKARLLDNLGV